MEEGESWFKRRVFISFAPKRIASPQFSEEAEEDRRMYPREGNYSSVPYGVKGCGSRRGRVRLQKRSRTTRRLCPTFRDSGLRSYLLPVNRQARYARFAFMPLRRRDLSTHEKVSPGKKSRRLFHTIHTAIGLIIQDAVTPTYYYVSAEASK
jgi:hypothetical protein